MIAIIPRMILLLLLIAAIGFLVFWSTSKSKNRSPLQLMLLGIEITLVGGILAVDPNSSFGGFEYLIVLVGLTLSIAGFAKNT